MRLEKAIATHDGPALADIIATVDPLITEAAPDGEDAATLARLHHTRAAALAGLAWHRPAPGLRDQAAASLAEALTLYRRLGMGTDLIRARWLLARLRDPERGLGRPDPSPAIDTRPRAAPAPISPATAAN